MRGLHVAVMLLVCLSVASLAQAQTPWTDEANQIRNNTATGLGARSLGMGGAFTAVADGPTAVYWNPAGLAWSEGLRTDFSITGQVSGLDVVGDARDLFDAVDNLTAQPGTGNLSDYQEVYRQAGVLSGRPLTAGVSAAFGSVSYDNIGFGMWAQAAGGGILNLTGPAAFDPATDSNINVQGSGLAYATAGLGYGRKLRPNLGVGITARYIQAGRANADFTATYTSPSTSGGGGVTTTPDPTDTATENGIGVDLGLIWEPQPEVYDGRVRVGVMVRNVNSPSFAIGPGGSDVDFDPTLNVGVAVKSPDDRTLVAFDVHNVSGANDNSAQFCAGIEHQLNSWLTLRAGSLDGTFTKGLSARLGAFTVSAAIGSSWDELTALSVNCDF